MAVRNFNCYFQKIAKEVANTKTQEFINRTRQVKTTAVNIFFVKKNRKQVYSCTTLKAFVYPQWYACHSLRTTVLNSSNWKKSGWFCFGSESLICIVCCVLVSCVLSHSLAILQCTVILKVYTVFLSSMKYCGSM